MMKMLVYFSVVFILGVFSSCEGKDKQIYQSTAEFAPGATLEQKIDIVSRVVPSPKQLSWQQLEQTVFFHFGMNTFTDMEWGDGTESEELFNPTDLNTDQWVQTIKAAGFKLAIITAKHHDGFCLWPTVTTQHSVSNSPWRDGKGDVVRELQQSCEKYGVKFGIYLSPWDRNASCYGTDEYNDFFVSQLTELLTNYGQIDEVWFDGACGEGPNGKKQEYDFPRYYEVINQLQPNAVVAITGDDVRWVGNEQGLGRETEWSVTPLSNSGRPEGAANNEALGINGMSKDLGSRDLLAKATSVRWWPSEVDVSIRPGWFYHSAEDDKVKDAETLMNIYFSSVGMNSVWLLNIPPDRRGHINEADSIMLKKFAEQKAELFDNNKVKDYKKYEHERFISIPCTIHLELSSEADIRVIELRENITKGQRVEKFTVEALVSDEWKTICEGTTIGYKRLLRLNEAVNCDRLRVSILESRGPVYLSFVGAYD